MVTNTSSTVSETESLVASRVQAITAAVAYAEQQTQPFACTVADVESCRELAGQHTMLVALGDGSTVASMLRQYSVAAKSAPLSTSACLLVPHWPHAKCNHHLKGMVVLRQFPAGVLAKYPSKLLYAPPCVATASSSAFGAGQLTMSFAGKLAGLSAKIAADSQASHNFVSEQWVDRAGVHVIPQAGQATLASGETARVLGVCSLRMQIGALHDVVECLVLKMASHHDLILGEAYLQSRHALLCYATATMTVTKGSRKISVASVKSPDAGTKQDANASQESESAPLLISA